MFALDAELIVSIIEHRPETQRAGGELEVVGNRVGIGAVSCDPAGGVAAADAAEDGDGVPADVSARSMEGRHTRTR